MHLKLFGIFNRGDPRLEAGAEVGKRPEIDMTMEPLEELAEGESGLDYNDYIP